MPNKTTTETAKSLVATVGGKQRVRYSILPQSNSLIPANSLGGQLVALSDLFAALAKQDGYKMKTLVTDISMSPEGVISFELLMVPLEMKADAEAA